MDYPQEFEQDWKPIIKTCGYGNPNDKIDVAIADAMKMSAYAAWCKAVKRGVIQGLEGSILALDKLGSNADVFTGIDKLTNILDNYKYK